MAMDTHLHGHGDNTVQGSENISMAMDTFDSLHMSMTMEMHLHVTER